MISVSLHRIVLAAALSAAASAGFAQALPEVQRSGDVEYVTGGIGADESAALKAAAGQWPLALQFAVVAGSGRAQHASDIEVVVRDARGRAVLEAVSGGPFLLARVAPGRYTVEATRQGQTQRRQLTVRGGMSARAMFSWRVASLDGAPR